MNLRIATLALALLGASISASRPDTIDIITLTDGSTVEGQVLDATDAFYRIQVDGSTKVIEVANAKVKSVRFGVERVGPAAPAPASTAPPRPAGPTTATTPAPATKPAPTPATESDPAPSRPKPAATPKVENKYVVLPLSGELGVQIVAKGIADALAQCRHRGAKHAVLLLDTPGGRLADAEAITGVLKKFSGDYTYHCVIKNSLSAGIWLAAASDHLYITDDGRLGAANALKVDAPPSEADDRLNSAIAAHVGALAESKNHPACAFRAMVVRAEQLFAAPRPDGSFLLSPSPTQIPGEILVDGDTTVLTLTPRQAIEFRIAQAVPADGLPALGALRNYPDWVEVKGAIAFLRQAQDALAGAAAREAQALDRYQKHLEIVKTASERLPELVKSAKEADPEKIQIHYYDNGDLTAESKRVWVAATDAAIDRWRLIQETLRDIDGAVRGARSAAGERHRAIRDADELRMLLEKSDLPDMPVPKAGADAEVLWKDAERALENLRLRRNRTKV